MPGLPQLGEEEAPGRAHQGDQRTLFGRRKKDPQVTYLETWPLFAAPDGDAIPDEFPDLLHPNEDGYVKWAAALRPIFATLRLSETTPDPFRPEEGFESLFNGRDLTGGLSPHFRGGQGECEALAGLGPKRREWPIVTSPSASTAAL